MFTFVYRGNTRTFVYTLRKERLLDKISNYCGYMSTLCSKMQGRHYVHVLFNV